MIAVTVVCLMLCVGLTAIWMKRRGGSSSAEKKPVAGETGRLVTGGEADARPLIVAPTQVVVTSDHREVMSMTLLEDAEAAKQRLLGATQLPWQAVSGVFKRLIEPLAQVAPSASTAVMANNSTLMEVVINGEMLAASDGNGLRAIAKAGKGFEHARLYEPSSLQNVANAAAIWQIASVVVAQKHLADISATMKRVESKIDGIQSFLEGERRNIIRSAMNYLEDTKAAIDAGEFLERTRGKLERFDIELDRVSMALTEEIERESVRAFSRDRIGCEGEYQSALAKRERLRRLIGELTLCHEVRLANWYLCSIYPDRSKMLAPRLAKIKSSLDAAAELKDHLSKSMEDDCRLISAAFTPDKVIDERRSLVRLEGRKGLDILQASYQRGDAVVQKIECVGADRLATSRLIVEAKDGVPSAVYLCQ